MPPHSAGAMLLALRIAGGLGALHAPEPGHGKVVTATHTAGVYVLGAVTLYASHVILPERLYPYLGCSRDQR